MNRQISKQCGLVGLVIRYVSKTLRIKREKYVGGWGSKNFLYPPSTHPHIDYNWGGWGYV